MKDLGVTLVREFQTVFGAYIGSDAEMPIIGEEAKALIGQYTTQAARLAEFLKANAQATAQSDPMGSLLLIRLQLIQEELSELGEAMFNQDEVEAFDALLDLSYVVDGTYITLGLDDIKLQGIVEVHRSNMSKLDENGKPVTSSAGRVVKGPLYSPPDLVTVIAAGPTPEHYDDISVDNFSEAMKEKLAQKRTEGRGGWEDKDRCDAEYLSTLLRDHVEKGDPVDVANLAMMLHQRNERIV